MFTNREIRQTGTNKVRDCAPTPVVLCCNQTLAKTMERLKVNPTASIFEFYEKCFGNHKSQEDIFGEFAMCTSVSNGLLRFGYIEHRSTIHFN